MPTYEYRCPDGHDFEKFVMKISQASSALPCPVCGKTADRRISAGGGLLFKGSGFYITDYGKDGKKDQRQGAASKADSASASSANESKGESKGDSKSESKGDSKYESKNESKGESKRGGESSAASKPDVKADSKPTPKADVKAAPAKPSGGSA